MSDPKYDKDYDSSANLARGHFSTFTQASHENLYRGGTASRYTKSDNNIGPLGFIIRISRSDYGIAISKIWCTSVLMFMFIGSLGVAVTGLYKMLYVVGGVCASVAFVGTILTLFNDKSE